MNVEYTEEWRRSDEKVRQNLPSAVKLVRTLRGHINCIDNIDWSPCGQMLAVVSDKIIHLWDVNKGERSRTLKHFTPIRCANFDPSGLYLASDSQDRTIRVWDTKTGNQLKTLKGHRGQISRISWSKNGRWLVSTSYDTELLLWNRHSWRAHSVSLGQKEQIFGAAWTSDSRWFATASSVITIRQAGNGNPIYEIERKGIVFIDIAWSPDPVSRWLAAAGSDGTVHIWDSENKKIAIVLEGHTGYVKDVSFSADGQLLASFSSDGMARLWSCDDWHEILSIQTGHRPETMGRRRGIAFNPLLPVLATADLDKENRDYVVRIYELDSAVLLGMPAKASVTYTSAKVVLVGESGVGKTGLGWRLAYDEFKEHSSTHGQQFWLLNQLCKQRNDGTQCEAVLWDLAGQDDYRLIHALFLDDADLALVVFDPTRNDDPLSGVEYWLKQLKVEMRGASGTPTILIAARSDRGMPCLTQEELEAFCKQRGIKAYLPISAKTAEGMGELIQQMQTLIPWDDKPATVTTETFKTIKALVLDLKENSRRRKVILTQGELRRHLAKTNRKWKFTDDEMLTAVGHLANHGYVTRLKTSHGEPRILLAPELLNNLAASFVLEARRNMKGLGSLEEERLMSGGYRFPELKKLTEAERDILVGSATVLFLEHNICFRETNPLNGRAYLVFPGLINLKKPLGEEGSPTEDTVAYTVIGSVENVYASLVVLIGYTQTFIRTNQWLNHARYEVGQGFVCGFRQEEERDGELDFVLYFSTMTPAPVRTLFQSLFENFLARRNLTVRRIEPAVCSKGHPLNRGVVRERISQGAGFAFCSQCGEKIKLPKAGKPILLTKHQAEEVKADRKAADQRSRFEQVLFRLKAHVTEQKIPSPECFISYAWGNPHHEQWVERNLATDLQKAGVTVILDRWENARIGASVPRFVERVGKSDLVIVVGTPLYRKKYDNKKPMRGFIVAAEGDLIGKRMIGTEAQKESVLPVLLAGAEESSFPLLLHGRIYGDFRKKEDYFAMALNLLLNIYGIKPTEPVAMELQASITLNIG